VLLPRLLRGAAETEENEMTISYCIPCHKRTEDLLESLPSLLAAADADGAPGIEVVLVDYGNPVPLAKELWKFFGQDRISFFRRTVTLGSVMYEDLVTGILSNSDEYQSSSVHTRTSVVCVEYRARDYYHMGHARNVALRVATGDYVTIGQTDVHWRPHAFVSIGLRLESEPEIDCLRSMTDGYIGVITCRREQLLAVGGYDERFEFYGSEDKDLLSRINRLKLHIATYDLDDLLVLKRTPKHQKVLNYRLPLTLAEMSQRSKSVMRDNDAAGRIVVNEGIEWGKL